MLLCIVRVVKNLYYSALCLPRERCAIRPPNIPGAGCDKCRWDFQPPDCCNCTDGLTEINGRCSKSIFKDPDQLAKGCNTL